MSKGYGPGGLLTDEMTQMERVEALERRLDELEQAKRETADRLYQEKLPFARFKPGDVIECKSKIFNGSIWRPGFVLNAHVSIVNRQVKWVNYQVALKLKDRWDGYSKSFDDSNVRAMGPYEAMHLAQEYRSRFPKGSPLNP